MDEIFSEIGKRLHDYRSKKGWTLAKVGKMVGISGQMISLYEKASSRMALATLIKIKEKVMPEKSLDWLIFGQERSSYSQEEGKKVWEDMGENFETGRAVFTEKGVLEILERFDNQSKENQHDLRESLKEARGQIEFLQHLLEPDWASHKPKNSSK